MLVREMNTYRVRRLGPKPAEGIALERVDARDGHHARNSGMEWLSGSAFARGDRLVGGAQFVLHGAGEAALDRDPQPVMIVEEAPQARGGCAPETGWPAQCDGGGGCV